MFRLPASVFHLCAWIESSYALLVYYLYVILQPKLDCGFGGHWKYLTFNNMVFQFAFFSLAIFIDLLKMCQFSSTVQVLLVFKDYFYASVIFPLSLNVFTSFWVIYGIDRELIEPTYMDDLIPHWCTHIFHTAILIVVLENFFTSINYPNYKLGLFISSIFSTSYITYIIWLNMKTDIWAYEFLVLLTFQQKVFFFTFQFCFFWALYMFGDVINFLHQPIYNFSSLSLYNVKKKI